MRRLIGVGGRLCFFAIATIKAQFTLLTLIAIMNYYLYRGLACRRYLALIFGKTGLRFSSFV